MPASLDQPHERQPAAIQDRHFQVVDLDEGVVDSHGVEHAQQVLGGGDQHALAHQAGGVADARHVPPTGGDREVVQIGAHEDDAGGGGSGKDPDVYGNAAVKPDAAGFDRALHGSLKTQSACSGSEGRGRDNPHRGTIYLYFIRAAAIVQVFDKKRVA